MTPTPRLVPDAIREVSSLIQSEVFKWPAANSVTPRVMELCQRLNLIAREIDAADLTIAHPSRGVVDEDIRWCEDIAADLQEAGGPTNNMRLIALRRLIESAQAAALPAVPESLLNNLRVAYAQIGDALGLCNTMIAAAPAQEATHD